MASKKKSNGRRNKQQNKDKKMSEEEKDVVVVVDEGAVVLEETKVGEPVVLEGDVAPEDESSDDGVADTPPVSGYVNPPEDESTGEEKELSEKEQLLVIIKERIEFFTDVPILGAGTIAERAVELARLAIRTYELGDKVVLNAYLDMVGKVPASICNITHIMDTVLKNSNKQRNAVSMMATAINKIARAKRVKAKANINIAAVKEDIKSTSVVNFIASKS